MPQSQAGTAVSTDPAGEWFRFWRSYLDKDEDPRFRHTWERGVKVGQRVAIERTASWAGLVPLLQDVLDYLIETAIERAADMGVGADLTGVDGTSEAGGASPASAGPDLTVGSPDTQVAFR